ncbi:MAG: hypothetical protein JRF34_08185 [Deltaproteobacteria bacterium]|nr:hypothetical protein [Deltaproteobacteria bacterium]
MYIVRADGTVISNKGGTFLGFSWSSEDNRWYRGSNLMNAKLYPGDTALVPQKIVRPNTMRNIKDITQIVAQLALSAGVAIAAINSN